MNIKNYFYADLSNQFISIPEYLKPFYLCIYEISVDIKGKFWQTEIDRAKGIITFVTTSKEEITFLNNLVMAHYFKNASLNDTPIDVHKNINLIVLNEQECTKFKWLEINFYEVINLLNRAIRNHKNMNYYLIHQQLKKILEENSVDEITYCKVLFNKNNYSIKLFCDHISIHQRTYDAHQKKCKDE